MKWWGVYEVVWGYMNWWGVYGVVCGYASVGGVSSWGCVSRIT